MLNKVWRGIVWLCGRFLCLIKFHKLIGQIKFVDSVAVGHFMTVTRCERCEHILAATDVGIRYMRNPKDEKWYLWNAESNFEYPMADNLARIVSGETSGIIRDDGREGFV